MDERARRALLRITLLCLNFFFLILNFFFRFFFHRERKNFHQFFWAALSPICLESLYLLFSGVGNTQRTIRTKKFFCARKLLNVFRRWTRWRKSQNDLSKARTLLILTKTNGLAGNCWRQRRVEDNRAAQNLCDDRDCESRALIRFLLKLQLKAEAKHKERKEFFRWKWRRRRRWDLYISIAHSHRRLREFADPEKYYEKMFLDGRRSSICRCSVEND